MAACSKASEAGGPGNMAEEASLYSQRLAAAPDGEGFAISLRDVALVNQVWKDVPCMADHSVSGLHAPTL